MLSVPFLFLQLWVLAAKFEVRQKNVAGARRLLGQALGRCPKDRLFRDYIDLEMTMGNIDRWVLNAQPFSLLSMYHTGPGDAQRGREGSDAVSAAC